MGLLGQDKPGGVQRRESLSYLSRLRQTVESRRQREEKKRRKEEKSEDSAEYFQVEISNRHSGGSDKYSVLCEATADNNDIENKVAATENESDYNLIDCEGLVPRSVPCSPQSLKTLLAEPDLIQDLPPPQARRLARSTSFSQGEYSRGMREGEWRKLNTAVMPEQRLDKKPRMVKRSLSAVTERYKPQQRFN